MAPTSRRSSSKRATSSRPSWPPSSGPTSVDRFRARDIGPRRVVSRALPDDRRRSRAGAGPDPQRVPAPRVGGRRARAGGIRGAVPAVRRRDRGADRLPPGARVGFGTGAGPSRIATHAKTRRARTRGRVDAGPGRRRPRRPRLRDRPRARRRRDGRRLRGPPARAQAPRGPEDGPPRPSRSTRSTSAASRARPRPPRRWIIRTSSRSTRSARARGRPFFSMALVEGGTLAQKLAAGPMSAREAAQIVETLARAVAFAHSARDHPPGPQAGERAAHARGRAQDRRLRAGEGPGQRVPPDAERDDPRLAVLHVAGAGVREDPGGRPRRATSTRWGRSSTRRSRASRRSGPRLRWRPCSKLLNEDASARRGSAPRSRATWRRSA